MITITNTQECFVQLWRKLERTRCLLGGQCRRFCIRNVLKSWMGTEATDNLSWDVCREATLSLDENNPLCGWDELPPPSLYPLRHREWLRALVALRLGIGMRKVDLHALDRAYTVAFPHSTPINKSKKVKK